MKIRLIIAAIIAVAISSCNSLTGDTMSWGEAGSTLPETSSSSIPSASLNAALPTIEPSEVTVSTLPSTSFAVDSSDSDILNITMGGIAAQSTSVAASVAATRSGVTTEYLKLYGTGDSDQNVWLEVDGSLIGFIVENASDAVSDATSFASLDLVFVVDNSGSMYEEADAVAAQIIDWADSLSTVMDVQFGCVGYNSGVNGAIDLTDAVTLESYLNLATGISRTVGYHSNVSQSAQDDVSNFYTSGECGATAIRFADTYFSFRSGANRIYVNLTDEPNQWSSSNSQFSAESFNPNCDTQTFTYDWSSDRGSIHTVMSGTGSYSTYNEDPANLSIYTGGTVETASSDYSDVTLSDLPVTGTILNSFLFKIDYTTTIINGQSYLTLTIKDDDAGIVAKSDITITF